MIYLSIIWNYFTFFLFTWYSSKLLKDVKGIDQYWHYPQMIFLISVYMLPFMITFQWEKLLFEFAMGLQFPFVFNSGLNAFRGLPISHLGKYDFLKFWQTIVLLILGIISLTLIVVFAEKAYAGR